MDPMPQPMERGLLRVAKAKRYGRKLSKLAEATPAIVRSVEKHTAICRKAGKAIAAIVAKRNAANNTNAQSGETAKHLATQRQHNLTLALRALCAPLYMVELDEGYQVFISANVLSDYRREGIACKVLAMPVLQRFGRIAGLRKADVDMAYVEQFHASRANAHAMGLAQNAWRIACAENDATSAKAAYFWLYHGSLKPCKDPDCGCSLCGESKRKMQAAELTHLAFRFIGEQEERSHNHGSRTPHKARTPTEAQLSLAFGGNYLAEPRKVQ